MISETLTEERITKFLIESNIAYSYVPRHLGKFFHIHFKVNGSEFSILEQADAGYEDEPYFEIFSPFTDTYKKITCESDIMEFIENI